MVQAAGVPDLEAGRAHAGCGHGGTAEELPDGFVFCVLSFCFC